MTPLRQKMTEDLRLRGLCTGTIQIYLGCVRRFALYFGVSPSKLDRPEVRAFMLSLAEANLASATLAVYHAALRFLYVETLQRPEVMAGVPRPRVRSSGDPVPLTHAEARALFAVLSAKPYDYTFFSVMLATGARLSECCHLSVQDVDRRAGLVHIRHGKGDKSRSVMLSGRLLRVLERYWLVEGLEGEHLFPAQRVGPRGRVDHTRRWADHPVGNSTMAGRFAVAVKQTGLKRRVTSHDLRRTFATWLLEEQADLRLVQVLLGHASPVTTARYTKVHSNRISATSSPYDLL